MHGKILVVGRSNMDIVVHTKILPRPGEGVNGEQLQFHPGGKGLNQAVAASRLGGNVSFVSKVGTDPFGKTLITFLKKETIDSTGITTSSEPSGAAMITVDEKGERTIVTFRGCNDKVTPSYIQKYQQLIEEADIILTQCGIPLDAAEKLMATAKNFGKTTMLNPAPAVENAEKLFKYVDYLVVNEVELSFFTHHKTILTVDDTDSLISNAKKLLFTGPKIVIVTLGSQGVIVVNNNSIFTVKGTSVKAIDATGAGDCFVGALAVQIAKNVPLQKAVEFANKAATLSVQREGASSSLPYLHELSN